MQTFLLQSVFRPLFIHRQRRQWKSIIIELVCIVARLVFVLCCVVHLVRKIFTKNANISFAICFLSSFYSSPKKSLKSGTLIIELVCIVAPLFSYCVALSPTLNLIQTLTLIYGRICWEGNLPGRQFYREAIFRSPHWEIPYQNQNVCQKGIGIFKQFTV